MSEETARSATTGRRWGRRVLVGLLAVAVLVVGAAGVLALRFERGLDRVDIGAAGDPEDATAAPDEPEPAPERGPLPEASPPQAEEKPVADEVEDVVHILVAGSDDRSVLTPEQRVELGTGDIDGERTEAIALVRLDPSRDRIEALHLPRDLLVTRCDGSRGRINAAYHLGEQAGVGGAACLVETVSSWTGISVDHFVKVDFRGFVDLVDAVGGVGLWLEEPLSDERANLDLSAGCVTLDGADALAFARARQLDSDYGRIARQQRLIRELADEVASAETLANPQRLLALTGAAAQALEVDEDLTLNRMRSLAVTFRDRTGRDIVTATVPGRTRVTNGVAFLVPEEEDAQELFAAFAVGRLAAVDQPLIDDLARDPGTADEAEGVESAEDDGAGEDRRDRRAERFAGASVTDRECPADG